MTSAFLGDTEDIGEALGRMTSTAHPPGVEPWMVGPWLDGITEADAARFAAALAVEWQREHERLWTEQIESTATMFSRRRPMDLRYPPLTTEIALEGA